MVSVFGLNIVATWSWACLIQNQTKTQKETLDLTWHYNSNYHYVLKQHATFSIVGYFVPDLAVFQTSDKHYPILGFSPPSNSLSATLLAIFPRRAQQTSPNEKKVRPAHPNVSSQFPWTKPLVLVIERSSVLHFVKFHQECFIKLPINLSDQSWINERLIVRRNCTWMVSYFRINNYIIVPRRLVREKHWQKYYNIMWPPSPCLSTIVVFTCFLGLMWVHLESIPN